MSIETIVIIWLLCGIAGAVIAPSRGMSPVAGLVLGGLLGVIGLAIIALSSPADAKSDKPHCSAPGCDRPGTYWVADMPACKAHMLEAARAGRTVPDQPPQDIGQASHEHRGS